MRAVLAERLGDHSDALERAVRVFQSLLEAVIAVEHRVAVIGATARRIEANAAFFGGADVALLAFFEEVRALILFFVFVGLFIIIIAADDVQAVRVLFLHQFAFAVRAPKHHLPRPQFAVIETNARRELHPQEVLAQLFGHSVL